MKRALVLDACQRSALATTRSLGKHRVTVLTADESVSSLAGNSRYSQQYLQYPSPQSRPEEFIASITEICRLHRIDILFPMTELTSILLLENSSAFPDVTLPFAAFNIVDTLSDKAALMRLATDLDVPVPDTRYFANSQASEQDIHKLDYPTVLKPNRSWLRHEQRWLHTSVRIADTATEAERYCEQDIALKHHPFMQQGYIPGHGEGIFALYDNGQAIAFFAHRRIREKPPRGGVSVLSESVTPDETLLKYAKTLLDKVGWHGIAMVEFRVAEDGSATLMEINTRFWGSLQLAIDAGVDFPWLLYQISCGQTVEPDTTASYKTGKRLRWLLGDIDSLYLVLRDSRFSTAHKLRVILDFILPRPFTNRHEVNRLSDLRPFIWELRTYLKELFGS